ncbi:MAG: patatin-like phospholipase family protein [Ferruginibacter sp.]
MKILPTILCCFFFTVNSWAQQQNVRPKIGLALSGGGAKGLAHIGILKAIDSAGLKIDYITGTSMGAVLGALYAVGYSGKEIEVLCKGMDWDILLSNQIPLRALSMEEKNQYSRFAIDIPFINNRIQLTTGLIQGQELNIKLSELFFHVYNTRDFNKFPIPFKCMATDLETGDLVVLDSGNIVTAIRASMAIPSIFTAVTIDDKKLVDGGLVRNFPVKNVKQMGADITIGSNVSGGLSTKDKISNPIDVILQMAFFKEAGDFREEVPLTDMYIYMPLPKYNMGSFGSTREIINIGDETGKSYYQQFKKLADSINALGDSLVRKEQPADSKPIYIVSHEVNGLNKTSSPFFTHLMDFYDSRYYTAAQISKKIHRAYGSRYYKSITFTLQPLQADSAKIIFTVEEEPGTFLKAGLYYSIFRGINANLNITARDFVIPNSRSIFSLSLGESIQLETEHLQYLGRKKNIAVIPGFRIDRVNINTYNDFKRDGAYRQTYYRTYLNLQNSGNNKIAAGIGTSFDLILLNPTTRSVFEAKGRFSSFKSYAYLNYNNLDQTYFPKKGFKINTEFGLVYDQKPKLNIIQNGQPAGTSAFNFDNYARLSVDGNFFIPLRSRLTFLSEVQAGINFTNNPNILNNFSIGGITGHFRNQVRFAGLQEAIVNAATVTVLQLGMRYTLFNNIYIIGRINGLLKDFSTQRNATSTKSFLSGYALTFAYKSPIGPLELSGMYCDQSGRLQSYVTFGIPF